MKRTFTFLLIFLASVSYNYTVAQLNTSVPSNVCLGGSSGTCNVQVTVPMPGATTYTWVAVSGANTASITQLSGVNGTNVAVNFTTCGAYTITCVGYSGGSPVGSPVIKYASVSCAAAPTVVVSSSGSSICAGSGYAIGLTGAITYTTLPGAFTSANFTTYPISNTCYTVQGANGSGCISTAVSCMTVAPTPAVQSSPPSTICQGAVAQLTATGANSFVWSTGATTSLIAVSPLTSICYSVIGTTNGCTNSAISCVLVNPTPTLVITASGSSICSGDSYSLSAIGANSYTWNPGGFSSSNIVVFPMSNTCYTVVGVNISGCYNTASSCVTVAPSPTITLPATTTVCLGSSVLLTANGANSYLWNTGPTTVSISVIPTVTACYSVTGTAVNGCTTMASECVLVNASCSDVWPGDANSDGLVDNTDVFEIGLAFGNTGPVRNPGGNVYVGQFANNWIGLVSTGKNKCHADCDGNGTINNGDTLAIYNNYSQTHAFKPSAALSVGDINLVNTQNFVNGGQWNKADIMLGSNSSPMNQLYGVAFDINFDKTIVETDSIYVVYGASFLNTPVQNVNFRKTIFNSEIIHTTSVRTNGTNVNGNGKIGELWFKVKTGLAADSQLNLSVSNAKKIDATGSPLIITGGTTVLSVASDVTGIASIGALKNTVNLFPNPTSKRLTLQSSLNTEVQYSLLDITGREILKGAFTGSKTIDVSEFAAGTYLMHFGSASENLYKKLVIER